MIFRGYMGYKEALTSQSPEDMVARIQKNEDYTSYEDLPSYYLDAVVAIEDHRFYQHNGFDIWATLRACRNDIRTLSFKEGGSTITQQLAKNEYFTQDKTLNRKISEIFMAQELERHFSKEKILELYVNSIYFGNGSYGIGQASKFYFDTPASNLNFNQATLLAGIPNAPAIYALNEHPKLAAQRQRYIIKAMIKYGFLTVEESKNYILPEYKTPRYPNN